ncbi:MAG: B12-binding domain-containing radical SAM protein [Anaerolineae bacterium]|nr:B12-binding domain-containing radical SAM protein [Anaerolineae bacterium]
MKIALLSPKGPLYRHRSGIFKQSLRYAPLTLTTLAALIPAELNAQVEIYDEGIENIDLDLQADLVGMTVISGSSPRAYEIADYFRKKGIPVVLGGSHVTLMPDEACLHADSIVTGYAEQTWPQLLRDFCHGKMKSRYNQNGDFSLANQPYPRRDLVKRFSYSTVHTFEATRACIHNCDFCVVPSAWGTSPYQKPIEEVIQDIRQMRSKRLIFIDLNLIADLDYAKNLFEALIPLKISWFGLSTLLLAYDKELLALVAKSGCRGLLIGFESLSGKNLHSSRKGFNDPNRFPEVMHIFHQHRISIMGCFVFGMDEDTPDVFMKTAQFALDCKIDLPRYAILTPFPGTPLYHRLKEEDRVLTEDWSLYDGQHVVFEPANMSEEDLLSGTEKAWKHTYSYSNIYRRLAGSTRNPLINLAANIGYRFYANNLNKFYTCDVQL